MVSGWGVWIFGEAEVLHATATLATVPTQLRAAMHLANLEIMEDSKENYVPVDTGNLRSTGRVDTAQSGAGIVSEMKYGGRPGEATGRYVNYAVIVHETNRNYRNGKTWKYLETPAKKYPYQQRLPALMGKIL